MAATIKNDVKMITPFQYYKTTVQEILLKVWNGNGLANRRLLYIITGKADVTIINQNSF